MYGYTRIRFGDKADEDQRLLLVDDELLGQAHFSCVELIFEIFAARIIYYILRLYFPGSTSSFDLITRINK